MQAATITERHSDLLFSVSISDHEEVRAIQLVNRVIGTVYTNLRLKEGDVVLVTEVPNLSAALESKYNVSHVILGLLPAPWLWYGDVLDYADQIPRNYVFG